MIVLKINKHKVRLRDQWHEITLQDFISLHGCEPIERAILLTDIKPKYGYLLTSEILGHIEKLTAHFDIHDSLDKVPEYMTYRKSIGSYQFPEVFSLFGNDMYLFYERASTFCEAHLSLTTAFSGHPAYMAVFAAYYLRGKYDTINDSDVITRSGNMFDMPMDVILELIYHHVRAFVAIVDSKQYPNLFNKGGKPDINGNKLGGLGLTTFLHEYAIEKHIPVSQINERVYDFFREVSTMRTMRR